MTDAEAMLVYVRAYLAAAIEAGVMPENLWCFIRYVPYADGDGGAVLTVFEGPN